MQNSASALLPLPSDFCVIRIEDPLVPLSQSRTAGRGDVAVLADVLWMRDAAPRGAQRPESCAGITSGRASGSTTRVAAEKPLVPSVPNPCTERGLDWEPIS